MRERSVSVGVIKKLCLVDQSPRLLTCEDWNHGIYGDFSVSANDRFIQKLEQNFAEAVLHLVAEGNNPLSRKAYANNSTQIQRVGYAIGPKPERADDTLCSTLKET